MPLTIPSDLEIVCSHHHRRQIIADTIPPIGGLIFHMERHALDSVDPIAPMPIDQLLQDSASPINGVYSFRITF